MTEPTPKSPTARRMDLLCATLSSIFVIVLVVLQAPTIAYVVVAGTCGANTVKQLRRY